jgi:hypothetical protein
MRCMRRSIRKAIRGILVGLMFACMLSGCRSMPPLRDIAISQINTAEQALNQASEAEAQVYVPETYLESRMLLRRAHSSMRNEEYSQSRDFAQRSREVALLAMQQVPAEQQRVKELARRLLFGANEAWDSYANSFEKEYIGDELIAIRQMLDTAQDALNGRQYMDGLNKIQAAHAKIAELPEAVERGRLIRLEEEKERLTARKTADEIIAAANREAENIVAAGIRQREQLLAEAAELAAYERRVEFERMFPSTYTVRSGETLIDIARRHEVFNDPFMWPLLYKANRDQIRDPKMVFPGQVLTVPRDITHEDIIEARKMAEAMPPYQPPSIAYSPDVYQRYMQILPPPPPVAGNKEEPASAP